MNNKPSILEVIPMIREYKTNPANGCGGNLHIVLDDANVGDSSIQFCIALAERENDNLGRDIGLKLLSMSKTQRRKLAGMFYSI